MGTSGSVVLCRENLCLSRASSIQQRAVILHPHCLLLADLFGLFISVQIIRWSQKLSTMENRSIPCTAVAGHSGMESYQENAALWGFFNQFQALCSGKPQEGNPRQHCQSNHQITFVLLPDLKTFSFWMPRFNCINRKNFPAHCVDPWTVCLCGHKKSKISSPFGKWEPQCLQKSDLTWHVSTVSLEHLWQNHQVNPNHQTSSQLQGICSHLLSPWLLFSMALPVGLARSESGI
ncbi:uncharacterized protein LOC118177798 [Oxyura jamaicensis]|uniref:uncharacterized protein LOC118177798 n=1 Tax=Oxyura jamaicensis TaxID=8884 RepID=UPI0015A50E20|nr:uncharacterized protein LOC118177798 [Oxyura jamaicensis]